MIYIRNLAQGTGYATKISLLRSLVASQQIQNISHRRSSYTEHSHFTLLCTERERNNAKIYNARAQPPPSLFQVLKTRVEVNKGMIQK